MLDSYLDDGPDARKELVQNFHLAQHIVTT